MASDGTRAHRVTITVGSDVISGWKEYEFGASMVDPAQQFRLTMPWDRDAWKRLTCDSRVQIAIDGITMMDGFIDERDRSAREGTIEVQGRDKVGRLVQTSIPAINGYDGLSMVEVTKRLAAPWFTQVSLSDARNRSVRRGRGHKAPAAGEPAIFAGKGRTGRIDPSELCWTVIEEMASSVQLMVWSSADGREIIVGKPNYQQEVQYLLHHGLTGSTVKDLRYSESTADRFALIEVHGAGAGGSASYGSSVSGWAGVARDNPATTDGTGRAFKYPKRLAMTTRAIADSAEAQRAAHREMVRRGFKARHLTITAPLHGQAYDGASEPTLFAPNTIARVIDEETEMDERWMIYAVSFRASRAEGETTQLQLVPYGTEFVA